MSRLTRRVLGGPPADVVQIAAANIELSVREAFVKAALAERVFREEGAERVVAGVARSIHSSYLPFARRLKWADPDPRVVLVMTEVIGGDVLHVVSDPFRDRRAMTMWERAMAVLRKDAWYEDAGWDSINPAVHAVHVTPRMIA